MRTRRQATINDLRVAIECLPRGTRVAMLEGIRSNAIIVGAYSNGNGVCPMLAAHRAGGRTACISFARAWDRFAFRGARVKLPRRATERELLILRTHLEASLLEEDIPGREFAAAMAQHQELVARREPEPPDVGPDRSAELRDREKWGWVRVARRRSRRERPERQPV